MRTILIIEDDDLNIDLFQTYFELHGCDVLTAADATTGLDLALQHKPAFVLMDFRLPGGVNGLDAVRRLKGTPDLADIPVYMISAHLKPGDEQRALRAGCAGFILKPVQLETLKGITEKYLRS